MRTEIKFRGLNEQGEFVYGFYVQDAFDGTSRNVPHGIQKAGCYPVEIDPETLGQFTGQLDCNGVEVFSGDLLNFFDSFGYESMAVAFKDGAFITEIGRWTMALDEMYIKSNQLIVIGNIHQNPELLEVK